MRFVINQKLLSIAGKYFIKDELGNDAFVVTPFVSIETFEGGGDVTAILTEIVEGLKVGLSLCS